MEDPIDNSALSVVLPAGKYACLLFQGGHNDSPAPYRQLLEFIASQNYQIKGESIERAIVDEFISRDSGRFVTEIQIPVKPRR